VGATYQLQASHLEALRWFERHAGREFARRPFDVGLTIKVTSLQKGIWKPARLPYAVSVVQTHKGVYDDQDPIIFDDNTWKYFYHQQGKSAEDLRDPQKIFANVALFACMRDKVPVGVVIPAVDGRGYQVLGLASVEGYSQGYFELIGPVAITHEQPADLAEESTALTVSAIEFPFGEFDPDALQDDRLKVIASVHRRQGAPRFRRALLRAYKGQCAMTRYDASPALEAAHIVPYRGPQTNHPANGLLLRADMHDLFDLGMIAVDTEVMQLRLSQNLASTMYEKYEGRPLWLPPDAEARPSIEALHRHLMSSLVA
jgi:hypothetical protein